MKVSIGTKFWNQSDNIILKNKMEKIIVIFAIITILNLGYWLISIPTFNLVMYIDVFMLLLAVIMIKSKNKFDAEHFGDWNDEKK